MQLQHLTFNLTKAGTRFDTLEGRQHLVCPTVMIVEGVHNGSNGPLFYPASELSKAPSLWDAKPVVVYHPTINGQGVTACSAEILNSRKVGVILNTTWDAEQKKLRAESWLDVERLNEVDDRVLPAIEAGQIIEVSTGLFTDADGQEGVWNDETFIATVGNYRPDHLAILPDKKGACSVEDGAGLLQLNALSHGDLAHALHQWVSKALGERGWVADVFADFFVYGDGDNYRQRSYTVDNDVVRVGEDPVIVHRRTVYVTDDGEMVGNASSETEEKVMDKEKLVAGLIANKATQFTENDREFLMGLEEDRLKQLQPVSNGDETPKPESESPKPPEEPQPASEIEPTENVVTVEAYVNNAPDEVRELLQDGLMARDSERTRLISTITANSRNPFSEDQLKGKPLAELRQLAQFAAPDAPQRPAVSYAGAVGTPPTGNTAGEPEALHIPTLNFDD